MHVIAAGTLWGSAQACREQGRPPREQQSSPELAETETVTWGRLKDLHRSLEESSDHRTRIFQGSLGLQIFPKLEAFLFQFKVGW